jgi:CBS domain-containing protein
MKIVSQLLQSKGHEVWSITPDTTVYEALEQMAEKNIGAVLVIESEQVVGIFSERDYARKVVLHGKSSQETPVSDVMTSRVIAVPPNQSVEKCMALMTEKRIRHLPVLDNDRLVGIISIGDVVKAIISDQEVMINHLEDYITGQNWEEIRQSAS